MYKILCPGEALIDFVSTGEPSLELAKQFEKKAGGAPANAAAAMSKLGVYSYFVGSVGNDPFGKFLKNSMELNDINTRLVQEVPEFTTFAYVSLDHNGERDFIFNRGADKYCSYEKNKYIDFDGYHFASATAFLGGELEETYLKLLNLALENKKLITFDPNYREALFSDKLTKFINSSKFFVSKSHIVKVSEEEALLISGESDVVKAGKSLIGLGCQYLLITLGKNGTMLFTQTDVAKIESIEVSTIDTTGAGDAFIGTVVARAVKEKKLSFDKMKDIVFEANVVGALTTTNFGALESIPTREEVKKIMQKTI